MSTEEARAKEAARLFSGRVEFLLSAPKLDFLPDASVPEIATTPPASDGS